MIKEQSQSTGTTLLEQNKCTEIQAQNQHNNKLLNNPQPFIYKIEKNSGDTLPGTMPAPEADWKKHIVDTTKKISKPDPILIQTSTGIPLFHFRNLSVAAAAMKVGKTKENIALVTAILHPEGFLNFHCPKANARALFTDTEMDSSDTMEFVIGVNKCLGKPESTVLDNFIALNLREVLKPDRAKYIEAAIIDFMPDLVIVDGVVDMCNDFNSISDSSATVEMLTTWASKYNCHIHTNIHVNKGANNSETRGHLGQILRQKGEVTLLLSKKFDTINYVEVKPIDSRHRPIEDYFFRINNDGLPEEFLPLQKEVKADILKSIIERCFEVENCLRYSELTKKIMEHGKVKVDAAKAKIKKAGENNWIFKNKAEMYCLRHEETEDLVISFD